MISTTRILAPAAAALLTLLPAFAQNCPDVYEPNDDCSSATVVTGASLHDTVYLSEAGPSFDADYFRVTVPHGAIIEASAFGDIHPAPDVWSEILSADCSTIIESNVGAFFPASIRWANSGPTVEVVVRFTISAFVCDPVNVSIGVAANPCATLGQDRFEPNDDPASAVALPSGAFRRLTAAVGDTDYFEVPAPRGSVVVLQSFETPLSGATTSLDATLEGAAPGYLFGVADVPGYALINLTDADTMFVRASSPTCARYAFSTSVIPTACTGLLPDAFEPNDEFAEAAVLHRGVWPGMTVEPQDDDWFSVSLLPGEFFIAEAEWDPTLFAGVEIRAYQQIDGTTPLVAIDTAEGGRVSVAVRNQAASTELTWLRIVQRPQIGHGVAVNGPSAFCTEYTLTARYRQHTMGQVVCPGTAGSAGPTTELALIGSPFVQDGHLRAIAQRRVSAGPWDSPTLYVGSALSPHMAGSIELCVGGALQYNVPPSHLFTDVDRVEVDAFGGPSNPVAPMLAGSTWIFQFVRHEPAFNAPNWSSDAVQLLLR